MKNSPTTRANAGHRKDRLVPKLTGADIELANFITEADRRLERTSTTTAHEASVRLLREVEGVSESRTRFSVGRSQSRQWDLGRSYDGGWPRGSNRPSPHLAIAHNPSYWQENQGWQQQSYDPRDWGRKWLASNGGCVYIDLAHLEVCLPEVRSCYDHLAAWQAMLRITRAAWNKANARMEEGRRLEVLANNSDGFGHSYGSHLNFLVSRRAWDDLFLRRMHYLLFLASFQVSSIVLTGQGKVGSENYRPPVDYQISARADFFETLSGIQTTCRRPIVNSRDEPHTGHPRWTPASTDRELARYHCIFYDSTLCHGSTLLKVGPLQLILAMIEAHDVNPGLILEDPLQALLGYSHDPGLKSRAGTLSGKRYTAVELQLRFLEAAQRFAQSTPDLEAVVPELRKILALWEDTLLKLKKKDFTALAPRLDWVLKMLLLDHTVESRRELDWDSPRIKELDLLYSSIDPHKGLYWVYQHSGALEAHVGEEEISSFTHHPPEDTRAWTRAALLKRVDGEEIVSLNWDEFSFMNRSSRSWPHRVSLQMDDPAGFTRGQTESRMSRSRPLGKWVEELSAPGSGRGTWRQPENRDGNASPPSPRRPLLLPGSDCTDLTDRKRRIGNVGKNTLE